MLILRTMSFSTTFSTFPYNVSRFSTCMIVSVNVVVNRTVVDKD